jgi:hypothetical protein
MRTYYVYVYFDPNTLEPFYVGKGFGSRDKAHIKEAQKWDGTNRGSQNVPKIKRIREILQRGQEPMIIRKMITTTEEEALKEEMRLIAELGRTPNGPLLNQTDGGEGTSGYHHKESTRQLFSEQRKGKPGHPHTEELKAARRGNNNNEKTRKPVYAITYDGKAIAAKYSSLHDAVWQTGIPKATMCANIKPGGLPINGFFYRYNTSIPDADALVAQRLATDAGQRNIRKVQQLQDGVVVATYNSIKEASKVVEELGGKYCTLWLKIKQQKPYLGYVWQYA